MRRHKLIQSRTDCFPGTFGTATDFLAVIQERFKKVGTAVCYLDHAVAVGTFDGRELTFPEPITIDPVHIQKARIFNEHSELLIWRKDLGKFGCRVRKDGEGETARVIDTDPFLMGAAAEVRDGFALLTEDRGSRFYIPIDAAADPGMEYRLTTRHYVDFHPETYQAEFVDMRFVAIIPATDHRSGKEA